MKTILIPTDFSSNALKAALFGLKLYQDVDLNIVLLHCHFCEGQESLLKSEFRKIESENREALKREAACIKEHTDVMPKIDVVYEIGNLLQVIGKMLKQRDIDMIVMGTRGETPKSSRAFGSNASDMVQFIDHPLIVVPELGRIHKPKTILFAADYKDFSNSAVLGPLSEVAGSLNAHVEILYVLRKGEVVNAETAAAGLKLNNYFGEEISHTFHFLEFDNPIEGIQTFIEKSKPDMLSMVARHREMFKHLFHESVTKELSLHLTLPLLVLHDPR